MNPHDSLDETANIEATSPDEEETRVIPASNDTESSQAAGSPGEEVATGPPSPPPEEATGEARAGGATPPRGVDDEETRVIPVPFDVESAQAAGSPGEEAPVGPPSPPPDEARSEAGELPDGLSGSLAGEEDVEDAPAAPGDGLGDDEIGEDDVEGEDLAGEAWAAYEEAAEDATALPDEMAQVVFVDVAVVLPSTHPVVVLQEADFPYRELRIPVGGAEGVAISYAARRVATPRPLTHEMVSELLDTFSLTLDAVRITSFLGSNILAELVLSGPSGVRTVDCRPSDAIALALRRSLPVPIMVAPEVLERLGGAAPSGN